MPKFEMPDQSYINEAVAVKETREWKGKFVSQREILHLVREKYNEKIIGSGAECFVVPIEGEEKKVAAYNYEMPPRRAKEIFYLQRILSTLFPHNFPHFYAAIGMDFSGENRLTGTMRERIHGKTKTSLGYTFEGEERNIMLLDRARALFKKGPEILYPFKKVYKELKKINLSFLIDRSDFNFMLGIDGGEYYIDTPGFTPYSMDVNKIKNYMIEYNYSDEDIQIVESSLKRLQELRPENNSKSTK